MESFHVPLLHGFGVKTRGLLATNRFTSADSLAWSYDAGDGTGSLQTNPLIINGVL